VEPRTTKPKREERLDAPVSKETLEALASKWRGAHGGERWSNERWGTRRRRTRDPRAVVRLLAHTGAGSLNVLDAACGTGRLRAALTGSGHRWTGIDVSLDQLGAARGARDGDRLVCGSVLALPFADDAFDAVVACRFLHHLADESHLHAAVSELVRVSRRFVVASYWDRATWPHWWRGARRDDSGRVARRSHEIDTAFAAAGARVVARHRPVWRLSAQTFVLAEKVRDAR
jgi:SAM-dependent methyltransferase